MSAALTATDRALCGHIGRGDKLFERWSMRRENDLRKFMASGASSKDAEQAANELHPESECVEWLTKVEPDTESAKIFMADRKQQEQQRITRGIITRRGVLEPLSGKYWWGEWMISLRGARVLIIRTENGSTIIGRATNADGDWLVHHLGACELIDVKVAA